MFILGKEAKAPWRPLNWKQGIFSICISRKFDKVSRVWVALRLVILWTQWIEMNDVAFNDIHWHPNKLNMYGLVLLITIGWSRIRSAGRGRHLELTGPSLRALCTTGVGIKSSRW